MKLKLVNLIGILVLLSACDSATEPQVYPEVGSTSAQLFLKKCAGCHNPPQPGVHSARMWPSVLQRMQMRIKAKGMTPLDETELTEILDYLQRNAATTESK